MAPRGGLPRKRAQKRGQAARRMPIIKPVPVPAEEMALGNLSMPEKDWRTVAFKTPIWKAQSQPVEREEKYTEKTSHP